MNPDLQAALSQLQSNAKELATTLESVRLSPGIDAKEIAFTQTLLTILMNRATSAITKGQT